MQPQAGLSGTHQLCPSETQFTTLPHRPHNASKEREIDSTTHFSRTKSELLAADAHKPHPPATELVKDLHDDMRNIETVKLSQFLRELFRRIAKDEAQIGKGVPSSVEQEVMEHELDSGLQSALNHYKDSGTRKGSVEKDGYEPLIDLCNRVLDALQDGSRKRRLDEVLKPNCQAGPIEFVRYDSLFLVYDWHTEAGLHEPTPIKPDVLIVFRDTINEYKKDQEDIRAEYGERTGAPSSFDPGDPPRSKHVNGVAARRIGVRDVLGCVQLKWQKAPKGDPKKAVQQSGRASPPSSSRKRKESSQGGPPQKRLLHDSGTRSFGHNYKDSGHDHGGSSHKHGTSRFERSMVHHMQLGQYAAELLSRGPYAAHNIGIKIDYDEVEICWFDRQNAIGTVSFNIFRDFPSFLLLITALSRFSLEDWGIMDKLYPRGPLLKVPLEEGKELQIDMTIPPLYHYISLHGRGTMVLQGKLHTRGGVFSVAVKASYPESGRLPEPFFISEGHKLDGGRYTEHFPQVYHTITATCTTSDIRRLLGLDNREGERRCHIIIFGLLNEITSLDQHQFLQVWLQCLLVHRQMWINGFEHGDVSLKNIMYRKDKTGKVKGVLNDWDLATRRGGSRSEVEGGGTHRTGTIPFAALDLFDKTIAEPYRLYTYGMESAGWVLPYACLDPDDARNKNLLMAWHDRSRTVATRTDFLIKGEVYKPRPGFENLYGLALRFIRWFMYDATGRLLPPQAPNPASAEPIDDLTVLSSDFLVKPPPTLRSSRKVLNDDEIYRQARSLVEGEIERVIQ